MQNYGFSEFGAFQQNYGSAIPSSSEGTHVTPGSSNTMGSWFDLMGGTLADDSYGIWLQVADGSSGGGATNAHLMDIGIDFGGGSSYSILIPYLGFAGEVNTGGSNWRGTLWFFPLFMPAGARLGVRSQSKGSTNTITVKATVAQKPSRPDLLRYGTYVDSIGVDAANSRGTIYVPGTAGMGAWATLGALLREGWWWQFSLINDLTSSTNNPFMVDFAVGDATSKLLIGAQMYAAHHSANEVVVGPDCDEIGFAYLPNGANVYVRGNEHFGVDSNYTAILHVLGGG